MAVSMAESNKGPIIMLMKNIDAILGLLVLSIVIIMIIPIPPFMMDMLLSFSITFSIIIMLVSMYILKPLEFSVFPSILLVATLARLSINVASTRLILLRGHEGSDAAGKVIKAFGNFVVGGNYTVGMVVFVILVVINFVVITKGAGRIAEVAARFTLDAMPGKQMSIDADLNAGLIDDAEARRRRAAIAQEAEFYGAMDGASKFVRGDAVAGIIITLINIAGGLIIGVLQHGMGIAAAAQNYTLLTIGDGLVTQIPALIVSTSAGIIVTRAASESNLGAEISRQILVHPKAISISAAIIFLLALIPGLPHLPFMIFSLVTGIVAWGAHHVKNSMGAEMGWTPRPVPGKEGKSGPEAKKELPKEEMEGVPPLDIMELNLGYGLIPLVDPGQKGELVERIRTVRHQFASEMGIVIPPVHIRDSLQLEQNRYSILIKGAEVATGMIMVDRYLALNPGGEDKGIQGIATKEPSFGLPALWILPQDKERAELMGFTVVDPSTVIATHLTEVIRSYSYELIGRQEIQALLDSFVKKYPKVVEELVPNLLPLGVVVRVVQNLLKERVPIRDLLTILETLADYAPMTKDPEILTEYVRGNLSRTITKQYQNQSENSLPVITLESSLEEKINSAIRQTSQGMHIAMEPWIAQNLISQINELTENANRRGIYPVLFTSPSIRSPLRKFLERFIPNAVVLSSNEIVSAVNIQPIGMVRYSNADQKV